MSDQNKVAAALLEILQRKRRKDSSGDRLTPDRPIMSRPPDAPASGWEKAAALIGAVLAPGSTIASMVLGRPQEESLFDRQIIGPDGKAYYPEVSEGAVPRMKKAQRKAITPNPIVAALQRQLKMGPNDPANDIVHQKINDRDFLVHATRHRKQKQIRDNEAIFPMHQRVPGNILDNKYVKNNIESGRAKIYSNPEEKSIYVELQNGVGFRVPKDQKEISNLGKPGVEVIYGSPGVSTSRQIFSPGIPKTHDYRFLLNPTSQKTFSTAEPEFTKSTVPSRGKLKNTEDLHESEQRTYGMPYPLKKANRAIFSDIFEDSTLPTEEFVHPDRVNYYRATMGNETVMTAAERLKNLLMLAQQEKQKKGK